MAKQKKLPAAKNQSKLSSILTARLTLKPYHKPVKRRHYAKWRLAWLVGGGLMAILGIVLVLFVTDNEIREKVDDLYYSFYAARYINPTLDQMTNKHKNIAYCGTDSRYQKLDIYTPKHAGGPTPVVIYIHGGGWAVGDKTSTKLADFGTGIIRGRMALASVNYRLAPTNKYPTQNQDVACAVNYIKQHAGEYGINGSQIGLWGDSAGGQLAAMTALDPQFKGSIKAVAEFYGTADIWAQINRKPKPDRRAIAYIGSSTNRLLAEQASPAYADLTDAPPFLLFHGTDDQIVPYSQSVLFAQHLQAADVPVTLRTVEHANHNFSANSRPTAHDIKIEMATFFKVRL